LFEKTEEQLREHDSNHSKEAKEQKRKSRDIAGLSTPAEMGRSDDSAEVVIVYASTKKRHTEKKI
jgi:hypothetical protein